MNWTVRRHRAKSPGVWFGWGAVAMAVLWTVFAIGQPGAQWRPGHGRPAPEQPEKLQLTGPPTWLRINKINVDAPLIPLGLDATGTLEAPEDYYVPGWYADGTAPGDVGPSVIAGHVDSLTGSAVFRHLADLRVEDIIEVQRDGIWLKFQVTSIARFPKGGFPTAQVYGPTPDAQLRVITCGGSFDRARNSYRDNVVVFAIIGK